MFQPIIFTLLKPHPLQAHFDFIAANLVEHSIAVLEDVFPPSILDGLRSEALAQFNDGGFERAHIGKGIEKQRISEVRGDQVLWLDKELVSSHLAVYWEFIDALRGHLSDFFRIHLERTELHFAVYPSGGFYAPHLDQFREHSNRIFSVILYLNMGWQNGDGGELRVHTSDSCYDIAPIHGRFVCFRSDTILHEVLKANKQRISLTGWMRKDPLIY